MNNEQNRVQTTNDTLQSTYTNDEEEFSKHNSGREDDDNPSSLNLDQIDLTSIINSRLKSNNTHNEYAILMISYLYLFTLE